MFSHVYAALVAIINTKLPRVGELIIKRLMVRFKRSFSRKDKVWALAETGVWSLAETGVWSLAETGLWSLAETGVWSLCQIALMSCLSVHGGMFSSCRRCVSPR